MAATEEPVESMSSGAARSEPSRGVLRVGVLGAGAMGRNHVRVLAAMARGEGNVAAGGGVGGVGSVAPAGDGAAAGRAGVELAGIWDPRREAAEAVAAEHGTRVFADAAALAAAVDAVVLAVPTVLHAELGCALLARGLHVLVEKPLAASLEEADRLIAAAAAARVVLAVGHVEFFNPAVAALLAVGVPPRFVEVQRLAVFTPRSLDVDVVLDLMIHDLQILHALDPSPVEEVRATGVPVLSPHTDIANVRIALVSGCVANLTASRVSAERVRKLRTFLPSRYYSIDYVAQDIHGYRLEEHAGGRRIVPDPLAVVRAEPLRRELESFVAACHGGGGAPEGTASGASPIVTGGAPIVSGAAARQALATALAVTAAIERGLRRGGSVPAASGGVL